MSAELHESLEAVEAAQARVIEGITELKSFTMNGPFIDLGFETSVSAPSIVAIKVYQNNAQFLEFMPLDQDRINTVIKCSEMHYWLPSSLTYKELRNRLRKSGVAFL